MKNILYTADVQWRYRLSQLLGDGARIASPRGMESREELHASVAVDMEDSLLCDPERRINWKFAAAEALWIVDGDDRVAPLAKYNPRMREFSDDGVVLAGAYGPRLAPQLDWCVARMVSDQDTRQAVASVWTPRPAPSKDVPCTLALTFMVRRGLLHCHAFMRSSDVWLGLPYDLFSFSQVALVVLARYNAAIDGFDFARPGRLYLTAASSHLYGRDVAAARAVLDSPVETAGLAPLPTPFSEADVRARLIGLMALGRT